MFGCQNRDYNEILMSSVAQSIDAKLLLNTGYDIYLESIILQAIKFSHQLF